MLALYLSVLETQEDKDKFEKIYLAHKQDMYMTAFKILKNESDAEDAVHQSFLKIAENFNKISHFSCQEIMPYIVIICRNTAIDMYRANKRRTDKNTYIEMNDIPDIKLFENKDYSDLYAAIQKLPKIYKEIIYLCDFMELPAKEVAKLLNISTPLVYKRISRARSLLKDRLDREDAHVGKSLQKSNI